MRRRVRRGKPTFFPNASKNQMVRSTNRHSRVLPRRLCASLLFRAAACFRLASCVCLIIALFGCIDAQAAQSAANPATAQILNSYEGPGEGKFVNLNGKVNWGGMSAVGTDLDSGQAEVTNPDQPEDDE